MKLSQFVEKIGAQYLTEKTDIDPEISGGYVSDLLSDVMGNAREGMVWITIMRHLNVVAVASLSGLAAILFSNKIKPEEAVIQKANAEGIILLSTDESTFETAGKLYLELIDQE